MDLARMLGNLADGSDAMRPGRPLIEGMLQLADRLGPARAAELVFCRPAAGSRLQRLAGMATWLASNR